MTTAMFAGVDAGAKARRAGEALLARSERLIVAAGHEPLMRDLDRGDRGGRYARADHRNDAVTEAVVKIGVRHSDEAALELFSLEYAPMALVAQGMTGFFAGRPRVAPSIGVYHLLVSKSSVPVTVRDRRRRAGSPDRRAVIPTRAVGTAGARRPGANSPHQRAGLRAAAATGLRAQRRQGKQRQHRRDRPPARVLAGDPRAAHRRAGRGHSSPSTSTAP